MIITVSVKIQRSKSMKLHYRIRLNTANVCTYLYVSATYRIFSGDAFGLKLIQTTVETSIRNEPSNRKCRKGIHLGLGEFVYK